MKNTIHFYYNLNFDDIYEYDNYSIIVSNGYIYAFKVLNISVESLLDIMDVLQANNIKINKIILNKDNNIVTEYNGKNYILTFVEKKDDVEKFYLLPSIVNKNEDIITKLWEKKIEFYTNQIHEVGLGNGWLVNSFNYYIGMAENAISIYNRTNKGSIRYIISHRRLNCPLSFPVFLDPTNMIVDVISRDISEYIKGKLLNDKIDIAEVRNIVNEYRLNNEEMNILLARLMYPSYYFDALDKFIEKKDQREVKSIVSKMDDYKNFIKAFYEEFKDFQLYVVDWIKK